MAELILLALLALLAGMAPYFTIGAIRATDDRTFSDQRAYACLCCAGTAVLLAILPVIPPCSSRFCIPPFFLLQRKKRPSRCSSRRALFWLCQLMRVRLGGYLLTQLLCAAMEQERPSAGSGPAKRSCKNSH